MKNTIKHVPKGIYELGVKYVKLGMAMQDSKTTLTDLVLLADDCGMRFSISLALEEKPRAKV